MMWAKGRLVREGSDAGPYYIIGVKLSAANFTEAEQHIQMLNYGLAWSNLKFYPEEITNSGFVGWFNGNPLLECHKDKRPTGTLTWTMDPDLREGFIRFIEESKNSDRPA